MKKGRRYFSRGGSFFGVMFKYSSLLNRRGTRNKCGGEKDEAFLNSVVPVISVVVGKVSHS